MLVPGALDHLCLFLPLLGRQDLVDLLAELVPDLAQMLEVVGPKFLHAFVVLSKDVLDLHLLLRGQAELLRPAVVRRDESAAGRPAPGFLREPAALGENARHDAGGEDKDQGKDKTQA